MGEKSRMEEDNLCTMGITFGCILHKPRATKLLILSKHDLDGTDESVEVILYKAVCRGPWCGGNDPRPKSCRIQTCSIM